MNNYASQTDRWRKTRRLQIAIVQTTLVTIILLTASLTLVIFRPIRDNFRRRDLREFRTRSELIHARVNGYFEQAEQLARQIPSRSRIREELVAYLEGDRTLESYTEFTRSKLEDAIAASTMTAGVYRFDADLNPLVGVGIPTDRIPPLRYDPQSPPLLPEAAELNGEPVALYFLPIVHEGYGIAGFDLVAVSLSPLEEWMRSGAEETGQTTLFLFDGRSGTDRPLISSVMPPEALVGLAGAGTDAACAGRPGKRKPYEISEFSIADTWRLVVAVDSHLLYRNARRETSLSGIFVLSLGILAAVVTGVVLSVLSRRTLDETKALEGIVEEQTEELRMLLKEVTHRIKNDIYLTNTLIELKAAESSSAEAKAVLAEAASSLRMMGELYTLLHTDDEKRLVDIRPLIEKIVKRLSANAASERTAIRTEVDEIYVPREMIRPIVIIVNELATNALKYGTERADSEALVSIRRASPGKIELTVADSGPGFPETILKGDFGFGMEMIRSIVRRHGGTLALSNAPGAHVEISLTNPDIP